MPIAIGDIHGCLDSLRQLVDLLPPREELVFLGDYIDRGPDSEGVVSYLLKLARDRPCTFLRGNHEQMMLDAIDSFRNVGSWLMNGGQATLKSYGEKSGSWAQSETRGAFVENHAAFFWDLKLYHEDRRTIFVHAGIDANILEMAGQDPEVLLWIRERFFRMADEWRGKFVIFGHTPNFIHGQPSTTVRRAGKFIGIDTGCVYGGCLTAIDSETLEIYQAPSRVRF